MTYNEIGGFMKGCLSEFKSQGKQDNNMFQNDFDSNVMNEYNNIKNLSQEEASKKLYEEVFKQKQNGSFDFNQLVKQVDGLKGYLPEQDFQNIKRILDTLK